MNCDTQLKNLATTDWEKFLEVVGPDIALTMKARILRKNGKSWQQISISLSVSQKVARRLAKNIKPDQNGQT